tara:strand:- start:137 stop:301 length:165 start_codon:yes stop_codon:yes gene_type:complete
MLLTKFLIDNIDKVPALNAVKSIQKKSPVGSLTTSDVFMNKYTLLGKKRKKLIG